jgi:hypothetical protein
MCYDFNNKLVRLKLINSRVHVLNLEHVDMIMSTKDKCIQIYLLKTHLVLVRGGRFWALRGATACRGPVAEIQSPKSCDAAEWLAVQNNFAVQKSLLSSSCYPCTILIQFLLSQTWRPMFKKEKKEINFSKLLILSTDCSHSIGLQSVLKIMAKTLKFFAPQTSPYKGSEPRVNLDPFVFSTRSSPLTKTQIYCRVDRDNTGASGPWGSCARDFVNFRRKKFIHRARAARPRGFDSLPSQDRW